MNRLVQFQLAGILEDILPNTGSLALAAKSLLEPGALPRFYPVPKMLKPLLEILSRASQPGGLNEVRTELAAIIGPAHTALLLAGEATGNTAEALRTWKVYAEQGHMGPAILGRKTRIYLGLLCCLPWLTFLYESALGVQVTHALAETGPNWNWVVLMLSGLTFSGLVGGSLGLRWMRKTDESARKFNREMTRIPVIGPFLTAADRALISRILSWVPENSTTRANLLFFAGTGTVNSSIKSDLGLAFLTQKHHENWEQAVEFAFLSISAAHKNTERKIAIESGRSPAFFADFAAECEKQYLRQSGFHRSVFFYTTLGVWTLIVPLLMYLLKYLEI